MGNVVDVRVVCLVGVADWRIAVAAPCGAVARRGGGCREWLQRLGQAECRAELPVEGVAGRQSGVRVAVRGLVWGHKDE